MKLNGNVQQSGTTLQPSSFRLPDYKLLYQQNQPITPFELNGSIRATPAKQTTSFISNEYFGKIGWGLQSPDLNVSPQRQVLENMPHKQHFDREKYNNFLKINGQFTSHIDKKLGIDLDTFQTMDIRSLRVLIKQRVWQQQMKMKNLYHNNSRVMTGAEANQLKIQTSSGKLLDTNRIRNNSVNYSNNLSTNVGISINVTPAQLEKNETINMSPYIQDKSFEYTHKTIPIRDSMVEQSYNNTQRASKIQLKSHLRTTSYDSQINSGTMTKSKCHKMQKLITAQATRIEQLKQDTLRKKEQLYQKNQRRVASLDYSMENSSHNTSKKISQSPSPYQNIQLPNVQNRFNSKSLVKSPNQPFYEGGNPNINFQAQRLVNLFNQDNSQQKQSERLINNDTFQNKGGILAESSNEQSLATGVTFLNNNSTVENLYEFSKTSSKINANEGIGDQDMDQQIADTTLNQSIVI